MIKNENLTTCKLKLKVLGPLFIGSGNEYQKADYIFNGNTGKASFIDNAKLFDYLAANNLADVYADSILGGSNNMYRFLKDTCMLNDSEINDLLLYTVDASDALSESHSLKNIQSFLRNARGEAYVPGSSLKGALRTAILFSMIQEENRKNGIAHEKTRIVPDNKKMRYINEDDYLSKLKFSGNANAMLKSIMRGLLVSDSNVIDNSRFILAKKIDTQVDCVRKTPNVVRECVRPDTEISFQVTFDESVLHGMITKESLEKSIRAFSNYYYNTYMCKFDESGDEAYIDSDDILYLGGGVGYFSKTLTYPYYGEENALEMVSEYFAQGRQTSKHHHDQDADLGISPHMLKYTEYKGKLYPFGACEVSIS